MGDVDVEPAEPVRRQVAFVCGQWRVTYLCFGESGEDPDVRRGLIVGPLVSDLSTAIWVPVVPDGSKQRTMIRRDAITNITPPRHAR